MLALPGFWEEPDFSFFFSSGPLRSAWAAIILLAGAAGLLVAGYLADRVGVRRTILVGLGIAGAGIALSGMAQALWLQYLSGAVVALGATIGGWLPVMVLVCRRFVRRRATAIAVSGVIGRFLTTPISVLISLWYITPIPGQTGPQPFAIALGSVAVVAAVLIAARLRNRPRSRPEDMGLFPGDYRQGGEEWTEPTLSVPQRTLSIGQVLSSRAFWLITLGYGFTSAVSAAIAFFFAPLLVDDKGYTVSDSGWVLAAVSLTALLFTFVGGWIGDRWVPKWAVLACISAIQAVGVALLSFAGNLAAVYSSAVAVGIGGGGLPLAVAMLADYFGEASIGKSLGLAFAAVGLLSTISVLFVSMLYDFQGDYTLALPVLAVISLLGGLFLLMARRPPSLPDTAPASYGMNAL